MKNKIIFLLFIPIALSKIVANFPKTISLAASTIELPQYGEVEAAGGDYVYMKLDGFKKGDKIYIDLSFDIGRVSSDYSLSIEYECTMEFAVNDHKTLKSRSYYESGTFYTFHYTIELTDDYKYLIIITPSLGDPSTGKKLNVVYK